MSIKRKLIAVISYLSILAFLPLNLFKKDDFIRYHAKQGIVLFVLSILIIFSFWLPVVGWVCLLAFLVIWITGIFNIFTAKMEPLPIIGRIAERISI